MPETGDVRNLERRVASVETQVGKQEARLDAQGRELGEIKEYAEKTSIKIDDMGTMIGGVDKAQVVMDGKIDQLLEFRKEAKGVVVSVAHKMFFFIGGILTLLALAILVAIELSKN